MKERPVIWLHRVRRLAMIILEKYPDRFSEDFERNKEELENIATITSKQLKNEIAGYITRHIKKMKKVEKPEEVITS